MPGLFSCAGGFVHRKAPAACPLPERDSPGTPTNESGTECLVDTDCPDGAYCVAKAWWADNYCYTPCVEDTDCDPGTICVCNPLERTDFPSAGGTPFGHCRPADCTEDADCGPGSLCRASIVDGSYECPDANTPLFACQTPADECSGGNECPKPPLPEYGPECLPRADGPWTCGWFEYCD